MWRMRRNVLSFFVGFGVALLGGLVGLGGAEFRLPFLLSLFAFTPLQAVIINKAISLVVVSSSFFSRLGVIPLDALMKELFSVINLLSGSLVGAWLAADWATKVHSKTLQKNHCPPSPFYRLNSPHRRFSKGEPPAKATRLPPRFSWSTCRLFHRSCCGHNGCGRRGAPYTYICASVWL